jgi:hypothetical protein
VFVLLLPFRLAGNLCAKSVVVCRFDAMVREAAMNEGARMKKTLSGIILIAAIIFFGISACCYADTLSNSTSWGGWTFTGNVTADNSIATLGDSGANYSNLFQGLLVSGSYSIGFDFKNSLSNNIGTPGNDSYFPDVFFASLYFANNFTEFSGNFDPDTPSPYQSSSLLGMQYDQFFIYSSTPLAAGQDWYHFETTFNSGSNAYVIPMFELFNLNGINGDSTVSIRNLNINLIPTVVPEPGTLISLSLGLIGLAIAAKKKILY